MKNIATALIFTLFSVVLSGADCNAQCKATAKKCLPELAPFVYSGQLNSTVLFEGESAELITTFTAGQVYRILTCSQKYSGSLRFKIFDSKRNMVFNNADYNLARSWDFKVGATEDYTIVISVPPSNQLKVADASANGCVAVLIGFKN
jgi:hypothetical protein